MNTDKLTAAVATAIETSQRENRAVTVRASELGVTVDDLVDEIVCAGGYEDSEDFFEMGSGWVDLWGSDDEGDWCLEVKP